MQRTRVFLYLTLLLAACSPSPKGSPALPEQPQQRPVNTEAMEQLQGIWVDSETEAVVFMARADSIIYPDTLNLPVTFSVIDDTLFLATAQGIAYPIQHLTSNIFEYENLAGETVELHKSYMPEDSLLFLHREYDPILLGQLVKRDTVVYAPDGNRYHLYINVNPTRMRVLKTTYTDEGMAVENSYYDNIIHIAIYEGRRCLFSRDMQKRQFSELIPQTFLDGAILSNMSFGRVTTQGCHFLATVCEPEGARCYVVDILAAFDGHFTTELTEY